MEIKKFLIQTVDKWFLKCFYGQFCTFVPKKVWLFYGQRCIFVPE